MWPHPVAGPAIEAGVTTSLVGTQVTVAIADGDRRAPEDDDRCPHEGGMAEDL